MNLIPSSPEAYRLLMEGSAAFSRMEQAGMRMDVPYLERMIVETGTKIKEMESDLKSTDEFKIWRKIYGEGADLGKREQLAGVVFGELGVECKKLTKGKKPATDKEAFVDIDLPFVKKWVSYDTLKRIRSTNLVGILSECANGYLRPSFNLNLAVTYRSSVSNPNSQNIPNRDPKSAKIVRRAFIPRDGHVLLEADFSGIEVRAAACYHLDPTMVKYIEDDYDLHLDMGAECYKLDRSHVSKPIRSAAKGYFVFASFYGDWYHKICQNLWHAVERDNLKLKDGSGLRDHLNSVGLIELGDLNPRAVRSGTYEDHLKKVEHNFWNERFPIYTEWKKKWWEDYTKQGWYQMKTGFVSQGVFSKNEVINGPIQGSAFHWLLWVLIQFDAWLIKNKMKTKLIGQIHDSMILDVFKSELQDVLYKIKELVTVGLRNHWDWIIVPLAIESSVCEESWYYKTEFVEKDGRWLAV